MRKNLRRAAQIFVMSALIFAATLVAPAQAFAQDGCQYTPQTTTRGGNTIFGGAKWTCDLPSSVYREIWVRILLEGEVVKETVFGGYGSTNSTFTAGVACVPGFHWYSVFTFGYDGLGPTAYPAKESRELPWSC